MSRWKPVFRIHGILGWIRIRGSMLLTNGSGSWIGILLFSSLIFKMPGTFTSFFKSQKESQNRRNQGFSYYFCILIEGSGSGSIPLTSGSGSGRPKNMRIRNTGEDYTEILRNRGDFQCLCGVGGRAEQQKESSHRLQSIFLVAKRPWLQPLIAQSPNF
jgi:hypothetical protein